MFANRFRVLFALVVAIAGVSAQIFDSCGKACLDKIVTNGCGASLTCLCTNTTVQSGLGVCLQNCPESDVTVGKKLGSSVCANVTSATNTGTVSNTGAVSNTGTVSHTGTVSNTGTVNATSARLSTSAAQTTRAPTAAASTVSSTPSNGATAIEQLPFVSALIVIAGVAIGGVFAL